MPLGVPERVDGSTIGLALNRAQQMGALTVLTLSVLVVLVMHVDRPGHGFWVVALALLPMLVLQIARLSTPSDSLGLAFLVFGGIAIFTIDFSKPTLTTGELADAGLGLFSVRLALILCGTARPTVASSVTWTALGYLVSECAVIASDLMLGEQYVFSPPMLLIAVAVALMHRVAGLVNPRVRTMREQLLRASAHDDAARRREALEQRAVALVHDTVLGQLHTIASSPVGDIPRELRSRLVRSVAAVSDEGWLGNARGGGDAASTRWRQMPLFAALEDARLLGLTVDVTGDPTVLGRVDADTNLALGLAAAQCLTNVVKHSGVRAAEVAIYGTDTDVCVMIIDSGNGFDINKTAADRLGLRASVKRRIEAVGGRVHVWSTLGQGTSIMLRVPDSRPEPVVVPRGEATDA